MVGDNLWISVDDLLVKVGGCWRSKTPRFLPTVCTQGYAQLKEGVVDRKAVLNCGFISYPQLLPLVTTNSSIDLQQVVREPFAFHRDKNELGL